MKKLDDEEIKIYDLLSEIDVDTSNLEKNIRNKLREDKKERTPRNSKSLRRSSLMAVALVVLIVGGVTAGVVGSFGDFINKFNPNYSNIVEPVELYVEDKGIKLEIIGGQKYENIAIVYLSLQDITGENRITKNSDFKDGFNVKMKSSSKNKIFSRNKEQSYGFTWSEDMLFFDEETNTAYYEFNISTDLDYPLTEKLTLGSSLVYFDELKYENEPINLSLSNLKEAESINIEEKVIFGGKNLEQNNSNNTILKPGKIGNLPHNRDDQWISNIGIIDNKIHVQIGKVFNEEFGSSDAMINIKDEKENIIEYESSTVVLTDSNQSLIDIKKGDLSNAKYKYEEFIFNLPVNSIDEYELLYSGRASDGLEGNWEIRTNLKDASEKMISLKDINSIPALYLDSINISPLGVSIMGKYLDGFTGSSETSIELDMGNKIISLDLVSSSNNEENGEFRSTWQADNLVEIESLKALIINGIRLEI